MEKEKECSGDKCNESTHGHESGCSMTEMVMRTAEEAWEELLLEKMKKEFEKQMGEKMNKIAAAGVTASIEYHLHMMKGKAKCEEHKSKLKQSFMG